MRSVYPSLIRGREDAGVLDKIMTCASWGAEGPEYPLQIQVNDLKIKTERNILHDFICFLYDFTCFLHDFIWFLYDFIFMWVYRHAESFSYIHADVYHAAFSLASSSLLVSNKALRLQLSTVSTSVKRTQGPGCTWHNKEPNIKTHITTAVIIRAPSCHINATHLDCLA